MKRIPIATLMLVFLAFAVAAWAQHDMSKMCTSLGECSTMITEMTEMLRSGTLSGGTAGGAFPYRKNIPHHAGNEQ